jgi:hypothetical protein
MEIIVYKDTKKMRLFIKNIGASIKPAPTFSSKN